MQQLVLLQDVTKLPDASKVLLVAAFTEILHFAFTSWVGLKPEYQLLGIFQQLDICFKPKLPSLESPVLTQRLEKTTEQKTPHNLSISLFHCGILLLPDALLRYWVDGLCPYLSLHNAFQVGHTPPPHAVTKSLWGTEKVQPNRSASQKKWRPKVSKSQWETQKAPTLFAILYNWPLLTWPETNYTRVFLKGNTSTQSELHRKQDKNW